MVQDSGFWFRRDFRCNAPDDMGALLPAALAPLIGIHLYLLRKHGEFGATFEYSERLAALRKRRQMEETFGSTEEDGSGDAPDIGRAGHSREE